MLSAEKIGSGEFPVTDIHDEAGYLWRDVLQHLGFDSKFLCNRHGPCPLCGGKDRFRFDDKSGTGTYFCNGCGPGTGIDLLMKRDQLSFADAAARVRRTLVSCPDRRTKTASASTKQIRNNHDEWARAERKKLWSRGIAVEHQDPVDTYLQHRGIDLDAFPPTLRWLPPGQGKGRWDAMLAAVQAPDDRVATLHYTLLNEGRKAPVNSPRRFAKGAVARGSAVRLAPPAPILGIAEGIETALAAKLLFGTPTWAALSAGMMQSWQPPTGTTRVIIFADNDGNSAGSKSAECLIQRLTNEGIQTTLRMPSQVDTDWADFVSLPSIKSACQREINFGKVKL
ncbi:toprim domain-containing protein [Thalassobacter stenotrophicus]|uniref:DNA primase n=2 Tax=Thalassobacter stenotrophicus TaxID=266809 RepID=A0A0P1EWH2_9RHOB|nr:toprim domain-containing protein [Thalassobacter stenotrophicus]CUH59373.1 DNA primase [Thalassobacter stenotrophicus]SHI85287.1 putative DNA primase/helicase [Thalassobacter stenotrophicus DSM 16310]